MPQDEAGDRLDSLLSAADDAAGVLAAVLRAE
jgi:hypothetical protein